MSLFNKITIGRKPIPHRRALETATTSGNSPVVYSTENEAAGHRRTSSTPLKLDRTVEASRYDGTTTSHPAERVTRNYETIDALDFDRILKLSNTSNKITTESVAGTNSGVSHHVYETAASRTSMVENTTLEAGRVSRRTFGEATAKEYDTHNVLETSGAQVLEPRDERPIVSKESKSRRKIPQKPLGENDPFRRLWEQNNSYSSQHGTSFDYNARAQATSSSRATSSPPYEANSQLNTTSQSSGSRAQAISHPVESSEKRGNDHLEKTIEQELFDFRKEEALMQLALGDFSLAEKNIITILDDPRTLEGWQTVYWTLKRADALQMIGRWQESLELLTGLEHNMQDNPDYAKKLQMMAEATYQLHQYQEAKSQCFLALRSYEQCQSTDSKCENDFRVCFELMARITEAIGIDSTEAKFYRSKVKEGCVSRAHLWQVERNKKRSSSKENGPDEDQNVMASDYYGDSNTKKFPPSTQQASSTLSSDNMGHILTPEDIYGTFFAPHPSSQQEGLTNATREFKEGREKVERVKNWLKPFRIDYSYEISEDIFQSPHQFRGSDEDFLAAFDLVLRDRNSEIIETLMNDRKIPWRRGERSGCTALYYAIMNDNAEIIKILVQRGVDINTVVTFPDQDLDSRSPCGPLHVAVKSDKLTAVRALLENYADPNGVDSQINRVMSPLHSAIWNNNISIVKLLIKYKASLEVLNHQNFTPLQLAADLGRLEVAELLLDNGAWVGSLYGMIQGADSNTPLHLAVLKGHAEVVELLLSRDASVYDLNINRLTPLQLAQQLPEGEANPAILLRLRKEAGRQWGL